MNITFHDLVKEQPKLTEIREAAQGWYQGPDRWRNYEKLKASMCSCVGMSAKSGLPRFMYTVQAYDVAHYAIFKNGQDFSEDDVEIELEQE